MSSRRIGRIRAGLLLGITMSLLLVITPVARADAAAQRQCPALSHPVAGSNMSCVASFAAGNSDAVTINSYTDPTMDNPTGITAGPDGAIWFTNNATNTIGRITTSGVVSDYTDPSINGPDAIAPGPDGALWFTNAGGDSIGRITTAGGVSGYPGTSNQPVGITAGPDGALWFTNQYEYSAPIGRITTDGQVTSYGRGGIEDPQDITTGPDGALWFTNFGTNQIGRITTSGVISYYSDPSIDSPQDITTGPDGALWFTNVENNSIGRITTAGVVSNYTDPSIDEPFAITTGPDGALWFTNAGNDSIGRVTTSGVVSNYTAPDIDFLAGLPTTITTGPDGALWFTNGDSSVGQVVLPSSAPTVTGTPTTPTDGGAPYYFALDVTGVPAATTTLSSGALPPGLNLSPGGVITGTPTALGSYTATVTAKNGIKPKATDTFTVTVDPVPPTISGTPPTNVPAGTPYSFQLSLAGFPAPTTAITSGALPTGLNLSSDGEITGTPTEAGTYDAQVTATNGYPPDATEDISIAVDATLSVTPSTGDPGTEISPSGAGFLPGEEVDVNYLDNASSSYALCQGVTVQPDGTFSCSTEIPSGKAAGLDGTHEIVANGLTSGDQATTEFTLTNGVDQPTLVLNPSSSVLGGEIVEAAGSRWTDGAWPIYECSSDLATIEPAYCTKLETVHVSKGRWQTSFQALIGQVGSDQESSCDLGTEGSGPQLCYVELQQGDTTIAAPLSWKVLKLRIDKKPSGSAFRNGKPATIEVQNFPAHDLISVEICADTCGYEVRGTTDSSGALTLYRYRLNCAQLNPEGVCDLVATDISKQRPYSGVSQYDSFITYGLK